MAVSKEKTALITGAAEDIGLAVAERLDPLGFKLILIDINIEKLDELSLRFKGATVLRTDLTDRQALRELISSIEIDYGHINLAFINAGIICVGDILELAEEKVDLQLELNLRSPIHLIKACAQNMVSNGSGHIISTVSMGGIISLKGSATYSASKFGLRGFLTGIQAELKPLGVDVSGIYPSGVDTQMLRYEALNGGSDLNFLSPPLSVDEVGDAVIKAIKSKRLEVYLPYSESISSRLGSCFPWLIRYLYPLLERLGKRGLKKYLSTLQNSSVKN